MLQAFRSAELPAEVRLEVRNCLGQCGNGPMVLMLPEEVWYSRVQPRDVPLIVEQHLGRGNLVHAKLYREFHPNPVARTQNQLAWILVALIGLVMVGLLGYGVYWAWSHSP